MSAQRSIPYNEFENYSYKIIDIPGANESNLFGFI